MAKRRAVRAGGERASVARSATRSIDLQVDRAAERRRADGRRADAALNLDRLQRMREIREVGEVRPHVLGIRQRHAVEREVDARRTDAAQREVRVARAADARLGVGVDRRRVAQQQRDVLPVVALLDLLARHVGLRDRRRRLGADAGDDDGLGERGTQRDFDVVRRRDVSRSEIRLVRLQSAAMSRFDLESAAGVGDGARRIDRDHRPRDRRAAGSLTTPWINAACRVVVKRELRLR